MSWEYYFYFSWWVKNLLKEEWKIHVWSTETYINIHAGLVAEKLEWGNTDQINEILQKHPGGFDFILGADIYILYVWIPTVIILN